MTTIKIAKMDLMRNRLSVKRRVCVYLINFVVAVVTASTAPWLVTSTTTVVTAVTKSIAEAILSAVLARALNCVLRKKEMPTVVIVGPVIRPHPMAPANRKSAWLMENRANYSSLVITSCVV